MGSNAASYAWLRFDKTGQGHAGRRIPTDKARKSWNKISVTYNAIIICTVCYFILHHWAHLYTLPLRYKREEHVRTVIQFNLFQNTGSLGEHKQYNTQWT